MDQCKGGDLMNRPRKSALEYEVRKIDSTKIVEVVEVVTTVGMGTNESPVRKEIQFWTKDGRKIGMLFPINL